MVPSLYDFYPDLVAIPSMFQDIGDANEVHYLVITFLGS